jgi:hypothetical protein
LGKIHRCVIDQSIINDTKNSLIVVVVIDNISTTPTYVLVDQVQNHPFFLVALSHNLCGDTTDSVSGV